MTRLVRLSAVLLLLSSTAMLAQNKQFSLEIQPSGSPAGLLLVQPGQTIQFTAKAFEYTSTGTRTEVKIDKLDWTVDPTAFGSITPAGLFTPGDPTNTNIPPRGVIMARASIGSRVLDAGVPAAFDVNTQHGEYTFSGNVKDASDNPVVGADVSVMNKGLAPFLISGTTDSNGDYSIKTPAGTFIVRAEAMGFIAEFYDDARDINNATEFTTDENSKVVSGVDFVLGTGGKIAGTVYNAKDNTPVPYATVVAMNGKDPNGNPGNAYSGFARTDAHGKYEVSGLPTGDYIVMAEAQKFQPLFYDGKKDPTLADAVTVTEGSTTSGIDFGLEEGGSTNPDLYPVSGVVKDENGNALPYAMITAEPLNSTNYPHVAGRVDQDGKYTVMVPAGTWVVWAEAQGFAREYYDNAANRTGATQLTLSDTQKEQKNIDFSLGEGGKISGTVTHASDGTPIEHAYVSVMSNTGSGTPGNPSVKPFGAVTDANGEYMISGLSAGDYIVMAEKDGFEQQFFDKVADRTLATKVTAAPGQTVTGIDFELNTMPGISGTVTDAATGTPIPHAEISTGQASNTRPFFTMTDANGNYHLAVPPGTYKISARTMHYSPEWYNEKADATLADDVLVTAGSDVTGIDFTLDRFGGSVSGIVKDASANGIPDARVIVWSNTGPNPTGMFPFGGKTVTNQDGSYEVLGVPPGTYIVQVFAKGFLPEFYDDETEIQNATPVQVADNQNVTGIDFELTTGGSIKGTVTEETTGDPIEYAFVHIRSARNFVEFGARSDQNGNYEISGLPTGDYIVFAIARNYGGEFYDDAVDPANATAVSVTAPNATMGIDFALGDAPIAPANYRGNVVAGNIGGPVSPQTIVEAVHPETGQIIVTTTDHTGNFDFHAWDDAVIRARALGYVGIYAGNTRDWKRSGWNGMTSEISFVLEPVSEAGLGVLEGRITDEATNKGIPNAWVYGTDSEGNTYFSVTGPAGDYALANTSYSPVSVMFSGVGYDAAQGSAEMDAGMGSLDMSAQRSSVTAVEDAVLPSGIALEQNYPNPFNPSTTIRFTLPGSSNVRLAVHNLLGQQVATLVNEVLQNGTYNVVWDAGGMPSGMYLYRLDVGGQTITKRMTLMK